MPATVVSDLDPWQTGASLCGGRSLDPFEAGLNAFGRPGASPSVGHLDEASPAMVASVMTGLY